MDLSIIQRRAVVQHDVIGRWQLISGDGVPPRQVDHWAATVRTRHSGVYVLGWGPMTLLQEHIAATLTAPSTILAAASAAAHWTIRDPPTFVLTVVRPGHRGPTRRGDLLVQYSTTAMHDAVVDGPLLVTTPARTLLDLWPHLGRRERERMLREALRLGRTTADDVVALTARRRGRVGASDLRTVAARYSRLPFHRCRSAAEAFALVVLDEAGMEVPAVNERIAGHEADLVWWARRLIIEIDGPSFHVLRDSDAVKEAAWRAAGFRVLRITSDALFAEPHLLLALAA